MKAGYRAIVLGVTLAGVVTAPGQAGPLGLPLGGLGGLTGTVRGTLGNATSDATGTLGGVVRDTVGRPQNPRVFERDPDGYRIVRGEMLAVAPSAQALAAAQNSGFAIVRQEALSGLGLSLAILRAPEGTSAADALAALRKADPAGSYDYDHIYDPSGDVAHGSHTVTTAGVSGAVAGRIGMIDGGIDRRHPAFADATIVAKNCASDRDSPASAHGTAVASLLVGQDDDFHGAMPDATLFAADAFGGDPGGGSADDIARALAWLAQSSVAVVNISLAGPPNALLGAAVKAFLARGGVIVAAVGNGGAAAPRSYPAAYPGVAAVTSVDSDRTMEVDASPGAGFAAMGVDVRAARAGRGYADVTGTSFAAPVVAARFAVLVPHPDPALSAKAWSALEHAAQHLAGATYGYLDPPSSPANAAAMK